MSATSERPATRPRTGRAVGIIGVGNIGSTRAQLLADHLAVDRVLVHDIDDQAVRKVVASRGGTIVAASVEQMLDDPELMGVVVATRSRQHAELTRLALGPGCAVLVEKPFTGNPGEARAMVDLAAAGGTALYAGYSQRFRRKFLNGYEQLSTGRIGEIRGVFARFHTTRSVARSTLSKNPAARPTTVMGPHLLDLVTWYLGGRLPESVLARTAHADVLGTGSTQPATTWAMLDYGDFLADVVLSWQLPTEHPASHTSIHVEVIGTEGYLVIDDTHTDVVVSSSRPIAMAGNAYTGAARNRAAFLGSYPPGDPVLGTIFGPVRDETYAFVEAAAGGGQHPVLATGAEAATVATLVAQVDAAARAESG